MDIQKFADSLIEGFNFSDYLPKFQKLSKQEILLSEIDNISARNFQFWKEKHAIDYIDDKWVKLNFFQYSWLQTISRLRQFGFSLKGIENLKKILLDPISLRNEKFSDIPFDYFVAIAKKKIGNEFKLSEEIVDKMVGNLTEDEIESVLSKSGLSFNLWMLIIATTILNKEIELGLIIYSKDDCLFWMNQPLNKNAKDLYQPFLKDHIYISYSKLVRDYLRNGKIKSDIFHNEILAESEIELFEEIKSGKYSEIHLKLENGTIKQLDFSQVINPKIRLVDILKEYDFQRVEITKKDGKILHIKRTKTQK